MAWLYRMQADGSPAEYWALDEGTLVVGRGDFADAYVADDALSQSHFLIVREGSDFFIVDLHSRNGTWINGNRISAHKLHPDEFILAGQSFFCFIEATDPPRAAVAAAPWLAVAEATRELPPAA